MGRLHDIGIRHGTDKATAHKYLDFYEQHIGSPRTILEFGVLNGASLRMWRDAFPDASVIGFDTNPTVNPEGTHVLKGDATDKNNWLRLWQPKFDLIIDDASHMVADQIAAFNLWWPCVNDGGHYIIEDIHTMHYDHYNPEKVDVKKWIEGLGIRHEYFWRVPGDESDSGTVIFFKE
jgi:hypothetical protein